MYGGSDDMIAGAILSLGIGLLVGSSQGWIAGIGAALTTFPIASIFIFNPYMEYQKKQKQKERQEQKEG